MNALYDVVIRGGEIYDGSGGAPFAGDVAITGDRIAAIAPRVSGRGKTEIDARGLAVAPGFINMLSWSIWSLIEDGRSQSEIRQGVTLEVMGEGASMGPIQSEAAAQLILDDQGDLDHEIAWTTLNEYLEYLEARGVSTNVASFIGTGTVRANAVGLEDRPPTPAELDHMRQQVRTAMQEGAVGLSAALIYVPDSFTTTDELVELARVVAEYGGLYVSHIRDESDRLLESVDELIAIARRANVRAEIYHLKASGQAHWDKMDAVIAKIEAARAEGLPITADMYTYSASSTGLDASLPLWVLEGGFEAALARLHDPDVRARVRRELVMMGDRAENVLLVGFKSEALKPLIGKTLAEIAHQRGVAPVDALMDLLLEDRNRISAVYFTMSEDNLRRQVALPWVSFCSDGASMAAEGVFLRSGTHPRAYGSFARLLAKYVRAEGVIPLAEAVRRLSALPARVLRLDRRGALKTGYLADVVGFDPATVQDHGTYADPHQYATGVPHVLVNGVPVVRDGEHTGATPGRVVRGPGWKGPEAARG